MSSPALMHDRPISSGELQAIDFGRVEELNRKHELLIEYMRLNELDALLLRDPANFSWVTGGAENLHQHLPTPFAAVLLTQDSRVVLCNNVDSGQLFDCELAGLGFLLKERPWTEDASVLLRDVCRGRNIGCDTPMRGTHDVAADLKPFRRHLDQNEIDRLKRLGCNVAHAVETTARNFPIGATESEIAGQLVHRLMKKRIFPVRIQVMADGQGWHYRNWGFGDDQVERHCVISAIVRQGGLHVATSRTVCIGNPSHELEHAHHLSTLVQATGVFFSIPGWSFQETWSRVARIYEKFDAPNEWRAAEQATILGYAYPEHQCTPESNVVLEKLQVIDWHPSVRFSAVRDTFLLADSGIENLTPTQNWPALTVSVKGQPINRPGILIREA